MEETAAEPDNDDDDQELQKMQELQETAIRTTQNMISHLSKAYAKDPKPKAATVTLSKKHRKDPVSFG